MQADLPIATKARSSSGLAWKVLEQGDGGSAARARMILMTYDRWFVACYRFDAGHSFLARGKSTTFCEHKPRVILLASS